MVLNADNMSKFVTNGLDLCNKAQVSYDFTLKNITEIIGGKLYSDGSKEIDPYEEIDCYLEQKKEGEETVKTWLLKKGSIYSITFEQNVKLDENHIGYIVSKSSLSRVGGIIRSSVFDPGYESTKGMWSYIVLFFKFTRITGALSPCSIFSY